MLKVPGQDEPNMGRRGSSFAPDPNFLDNSRRRNSNFRLASNSPCLTRKTASPNPGRKAMIPDMSRRGSRFEPSMDPTGIALGNRRSSIVNVALNVGKKFKKM